MEDTANPSPNIEIISLSEKAPKKKERHPNSGKKPGTLSAKTQKAISLVVNHGVDPKEAYTLTNGQPPTPPALTRLKQKVEKYGLRTPQMQKLAHQAVKDVLQGKVVEIDAVKIFSNGEKVPYIEKIVPKPNEKLAAAAMVFDRVDPEVKLSQNLNLNIEADPVDLGKYLLR